MHFNEIDTINDACCTIFCDIRLAIVSKHSKLAKRQARDRYERFASPSSRTAPCPSRHEVRSSSCRRTAPPPSSDSDDSVVMWVAAPPSTHLAPLPPLTRVWVFPHLKDVSSYEHCFF
jgi:hypothetical protein